MHRHLKTQWSVVGTSLIYDMFLLPQGPSTAPGHRNHFICEAIIWAPEVTSSYCLLSSLLCSCWSYPVNLILLPDCARPYSPSPSLPLRGPDLPLRTDILFFLKQQVELLSVFMLCAHCCLMAALSFFSALHFSTSLVGWIILISLSDPISDFAFHCLSQINWNWAADRHLVCLLLC